VGLVVNYTDRGMRDDDVASVATPPKMLMRQSIRDFRRRKKFFGVSRRLYQSENSSSTVDLATFEAAE